MVKSVGHLLRTIYIDADLKNHLNEMLRASEPDSPQFESARSAVLSMAGKANAYSVATQIRAYLEEKTPVGTEAWVYPTAGDLFLDGLEYQLLKFGPNLFQDHYSGLLSCYKVGCDPARLAQAPFYCADLLLKRLCVLFLHRDSIDTQPAMGTGRFLQPETPGYEGQVKAFQARLQHILEDGIEYLMSTAALALDKRLTACLAGTSEPLRGVVQRWPAFLKSLESSQESEEALLLRMYEMARQLGYLPLENFLREELSRIYKKDEPLQTLDETDPHVVHAFEGGESWMQLGNDDRSETAYLFACRRYDRAIGLFNSIHDRTSEAKAWVERARALMQRGEDRPLVRRALREAVRLVYAHKRNLPPRALPEIEDKLVYDFLYSKGYVLEATAFRDSFGIG